MDPVGMVLSAFLQVLFDRVASRAVLDFFKAKKLDERLLQKLEITLLAIDKLLDDAEMKQTTDKRVKMWLEKLQLAVYDAEDFLDAINTEVMQRQLKEESRLESTTSRLNQSSRFISIKTRLRELIKVRNIFKPSTVESKLKEILQRLKDIANQKDFLGLQEGVSFAAKPNENFQTTSLPDELTVYGRNDDKESIMNLLLAENSSDDSLGVIIIKGMGGIGKTTLAQLVYNDNRVDQHFDFKAWVCISEEFDVSNVTRIMLEALASSTSVTNNLDLMQVSLKNKLSDKKFLLILDDVWNEDSNKWNKLKKPLQYGLKGSKILVTTRNERVAQIMRTVPTYYLEKLSEEDCWALFAKYAFESGESHAHPTFRNIGREIVKRCEGLPLAAKALGGLLRNKTTTEEWVKIMESNVWDLTDADCNILPVLQLSYHYLPSHLKRCFAFASIFPKAYEFGKDELILLWAAQSLLLETGGEMEDVGGRYFSDLISRSFFKRSSANSSLFVMHDLMHDLATFVSGHSCCCVNRDGMQVTSKMIRHMSYFRMSLKRFETLPRTNTLRTFIQLYKQKRGKRIDWDQHDYLYHEQVPSDLITRFNFMRVLSLRGYLISALPESIGSLKHLRYFDLSRTAIMWLPDSICDLYNLQTFILASCLALQYLPTNTWKLVNLFYLDITECYGLKVMPGNLGKLKNLARLSKFVVGKNRNAASIRDLGPLVNLHGKLSILSLQNVLSPVDATEARLKDKKHLEELKLSWKLDRASPSNIDQGGVRGEYEVLAKLQPHKNLKDLTIEYYGDARFPNWIEDPLYTNMVSLTLENCNYCRSIPMLGQLPSLKKLYITGFDGLHTLNAEFYGKTSPGTKPFESLEILGIDSMLLLEEWFHCDGEVFPLLQELHIENCPKFRRNLPAHLPSLITLTIGKCPQLAASLPEVPALSFLRLKSSNMMLLNHVPAGLQSLEIHECILDSLPENMTKISRHLQFLEVYKCNNLTSIPQSVFSPSLKSVIIDSCSKIELPMHQEYGSLERLTIRDCNSLQFFPLQYFPELGHLEIGRCSNLESFSFPAGTSVHEFPSLTRLNIYNCKMFLGFPDGGFTFPNLRYFSFWFNDLAKALPDQMQSSQFLQTFSLGDCPKIESLPQGGLPSSLMSLEISCCNTFVAKLFDWGLHGLNSLRDLEISFEKCRGMVLFPAEGLLPKSLSQLTIKRIFALETLEYKGLQHLTSLTELTIVFCPRLKCIPPEGLPASLTHLSIRKCPLLERRLQRDRGEDWDKISHIPCIVINDKEVLS